MIEFTRRHAMATILCVVALILTFSASWLFGGFQIGIGPEFIVKAFAKLFYLGFAFVCTHLVVKYGFPTVYWYCYTKGDEKQSQFSKAWEDAKGEKKGFYDQRITQSINTHIGVFIGICLLLALAF